MGYMKMLDTRIHLCITITPEQRRDLTDLFRGWKGMQQRVLSSVIKSLIATMKQDKEAVFKAAIENKLHISLMIPPRNVEVTNQDIEEKFQE